MHKAVFLDRDGVVNKEIGYVTCADELELLPDSIKAMKELQQKGYLLIIITNQGGITKGLYSELDLKNIHDKMKNELEEQGIKITEIYYCLHHDKYTKCLCRKPDSMMIEKGIARFDIDVSTSYMVGDFDRDIEAGEKAGLKAIKIESNSSLLNILHLID